MVGRQAQSNRFPGPVHGKGNGGIERVVEVAVSHSGDILVEASGLDVGEQDVRVEIANVLVPS